MQPVVSLDLDNLSNGIVVHLDEMDPAKHASVLTNVANLLAGVEAGTPIELVVHGPGLAVALVDSPHADALRDLLHRGVAVTACANTIRSLGLPADRLSDGVGIAPSGVVRLVQRQRQGWAYLRP
ncbi:MAG: DsrE family protein [Actinomycetales bacterium]|nr:DsrE family protein [Actinomycetales bacterium]